MGGVMASLDCGGDGDVLTQVNAAGFPSFGEGRSWGHLPTSPRILTFAASPDPSPNPLPQGEGLRAGSFGPFLTRESSKLARFGSLSPPGRGLGVRGRSCDHPTT